MKVSVEMPIKTIADGCDLVIKGLETKKEQITDEIIKLCESWYDSALVRAERNWKYLWRWFGFSKPTRTTVIASTKRQRFYSSFDVRGVSYFVHIDFYWSVLFAKSKRVHAINEKIEQFDALRKTAIQGWRYQNMHQRFTVDHRTALVLAEAIESEKKSKEQQNDQS